MPGLVEDDETMDHFPAQDISPKRLNELAGEWGIGNSPIPSPLPRPERPPSVRTDNDDAEAEELLKRQRMLEHQGSQSKASLSRAFTHKKKAWEYKEIYNALITHITNAGSPGVAEALIDKLTLAGGNLNLAQKSKTNLLRRRKSLDLSERSHVLQLAVQNRQTDMVEVLLPYADSLSLDSALPTAFRNEDLAIVELLIRYGASAVGSDDGQDAFRQGCAIGGQAELVTMVLSSDGRPPEPWLSQCMVEATRAGCLATVNALAQSLADANHDGAAALKAAIDLGRRDIALALVIGNKPPEQHGLNEAFEQLMSLQNYHPNEKMAMTEILLCAGAGGDVVAEALVQASATYFLDMVQLLVSYGASIEYQEANALRKAISKGKVDLVEVLLQGKSSLSPAYASECLELMPKKMRFEDRHTFLNLLLRKGANGPALDEALIDAAEAGDVEAARLLLVPLFPASRSGDVKRGPRSMIFEKHEVASTNHKGGLALQIAVKNKNVPITKLILSNPPSLDAMAQVFPSVRNLPRLERYQMTEAFLGAGLKGPCVHSALQNVIDETPPHRDERLVALFLRSNADVNFNEGASITAAIAQKDMSLLSRLLKSNPTPQTAAKAILRAMEIKDPDKRSRMITMLLHAGAPPGGPEVSAAFATVLQTQPVDKSLVRVLLEQGQADVNINGGDVISNAVLDPDPEILDLIMALGNPSPDILERALRGLGHAPSCPAKTEKLGALLQRCSSQDTMSQILVQEVQTITEASPEKRNLSVLKTLLAKGVDINAQNGEALCRAIAACDSQIVDLIFDAQPNANSLAFAMPHALRIQDVMDRLAFTKKILQGSIVPGEVNRALVFAVSTYPNDLPLVNTLLAHADTEDGLALIEAIKKENHDVLELMLERKEFSSEILNNGFTVATKAKNKEHRRMSCGTLLKFGASGDVVSDALFAAATDGDLDFGTTLVQNGASVEHRDGQAVVEACRTGAAGVLAMLLSGESKLAQQTLQRGFQAATELGDLKKRAEIFKLLLGAGAQGEVVDAQLVSAERYGDGGTELVRLLLEYGASPDYNNGEAVAKATESAFLGNLEMLLGIVEVSGQHKKPSSATRMRAMDACWDLNQDTRYTIMEWLFTGGKPVPSVVHAALTRVVNEEEPEERLIQLLVANRASPTANNCQTLIEATRTLSAPQFAKLLESKITPEEASFAFGKAFVPKSAASWLTDRGYQIARCLLKKGACGDGVNSAFIAVLGQYAEDPGDLTSKFVELLLKYDADINHNHGEVLQAAATRGDSGLLKRLLQQRPSTESLTMAFPKIFDAGVDEDDVHELIKIFTEYADGHDRVDVMFVYPGSEPVVVRALSQFPRSTKILKALLDAGFYHEQMTTARVMEEIDEEEQVTLLMWALLQPQKKISSAVINMLIDGGAKVNFETSVTRVTPLMLAIQSRRQDIVKTLLLAGAEVDIADATDKSPLSMASAIGGELAITMMSNLLAAGASRNDGSLHNAARELNLRAMQILVEYRHDPDFPSPLHGGRSALGELCLHAAGTGPIMGPREKALEKAIDFLLPLSDVTLQSDGKSVLLLAMESADPLTTTKVLLRADMWKYINKPFNIYTDGKFTYSPTQYAPRVLPQSDITPDLVKLLKANRGIDVYYANSGAQPDDAVGMPAHIELEEQERKIRLARIAKENEDHALALQRNKELAAVQAQIWANQADLEDARKKRSHSEDLSALQERGRVEEELFSKALAQQRAKQSQDIAHQNALTDASLNRAQTVGEAELQLQSDRQRRMIEWERDLGSERVGNATQLSNIRLAEREELERVDQGADARFKERLREQKRLVDSQTGLAAQLGNGSGARRQIGYVAGELD